LVLVVIVEIILLSAV